MMREFLKSRWSQVGIILIIFGWGPLLAVIFLSVIGLWPDPNPNPIGPGLLFAATAWPAIICLTIGIVRTFNRRNQSSLNSAQLPTIQSQSIQSEATQINPTPQQYNYIDSRGIGASLGFIYFVILGTPGAFFKHLPWNFNYLHVYQHGRRYAWDSKSWPTFEEYKRINDQVDIIAKYLLIISISILVIFFVAIELIT